jgi:diguanylate cyclase
VAEESNLTDDLTRYLIYRALGQRSRWEDLLGAPVPIIVGINHRDLMSRSLPAALVDMLDATGSSSTQLVLEFGEPILQWDGTARAAAALSELGVSLSMDCFGTGRSSLPQLSTLPIDTIKIAQDLVARLDEAPVRRLVHAIIDSATQLGKDSAARGIEDVEQAQSLLDLGCEIGQGPSTQGNDGYLFGSPRPADELVDIIDRHPKTRRRSARVTHLDHHRPRRS